jgi:hypothetical protein
MGGEREQTVPLAAFCFVGNEPPATRTDAQLAVRMREQVVIPARMPLTTAVQACGSTRGIPVMAALDTDRGV